LLGFGDMSSTSLNTEFGAMFSWHIRPAFHNCGRDWRFKRFILNGDNLIPLQLAAHHQRCGRASMRCVVSTRVEIDGRLTWVLVMHWIHEEWAELVIVELSLPQYATITWIQCCPDLSVDTSFMYSDQENGKHKLGKPTDELRHAYAYLKWDLSWFSIYSLSS